MTFESTSASAKDAKAIEGIKKDISSLYSQVEVSTLAAQTQIEIDLIQPKFPGKTKKVIDENGNIKLVKVEDDPNKEKGKYKRKPSPFNPFVNDLSKITEFINHNISILSSVISNSRAYNVKDLQDSFQYRKDILDEIDNEVDEAGVESIVSSLLDGLHYNYKQKVLERFIVYEEDKNFTVSFCGNRDSTFTNWVNHWGYEVAPSSLNYYMSTLSNSNPSLYQNVEAASLAALSALDRIARTDVTTLSSGKVFEVPLDFDFSSLFLYPKEDSGKTNAFATKVNQEFVNEKKSNFSLNVYIKCSRDVSSFSSNTARLSAIRVVILPKLKVSKEAMCYFTQSSDVSKIRISTVHAWASAWAKSWDKGVKPDDSLIVVSLLDNLEFSKKKQTLGIKNDDTRGDEDSIFVDFDGSFTFAPRESQISDEAAKEYIEVYDKYVRECANAGEPVVLLDNADNRADISYLTTNSATSQIYDAVSELEDFGTYPMVVNWDLNFSGSVDPLDPTSFSSIKLEGGNKPSVVSISELVSTNIFKSIHYLTGHNRLTEKPASNPGTTQKKRKRKSSGKMIDDAIGLIEGNRAFDALASVYAYLRQHKKVRDLDEFLEAAAQKIHGGPVPSNEFEYALYKQSFSAIGKFISDDCTKFGFSAARSVYEKNEMDFEINSTVNFGGIGINNVDPKHVDFVKEYNRFYKFMNIWTMSIKIGNSMLLLRWETNRQRAQGNYNPVDIADSRYYIDNKGSAKYLQDAYNNYVVFRAFCDLCKELLEYLNKPDNLIFKYDKNAPRPTIGYMKPMPDFSVICESLGPTLAAFGKYYPNADKYIKDGEAEQQKFVVDPNDEETPVIPGAFAGKFKLFKHQAKALAQLKHKPRVSLLDIAPGGGKTVTGLADCAFLMGEGDVKLPLIVAPANLVKNWMNDVNQIVTDRKFNCIPITTKTVRSWGEKKLSRMIKNAPPNTIFFTDLNFIKLPSASIPVYIMDTEIQVNTNLEWLKQFDWDYILFDESHLLKGTKGANGGSQQSRFFAELTLRKSVKFIRLASGTLIHKDVDDIIGQARLFDPSIFRSREEFCETYSDPQKGGWLKDAANLIRKQLSKYCAVARAKRKDWAYALPAQNREHPEEWLVQMDDEFLKVYEYVWQQAFGAMKEDKSLLDALKEDEENLSGEDDNTNPMGIHVSRLEKFLICPENDKANGYEGLDFSKLNPPKMKKLIELLDSQFSRPKFGKVIVFVRHIECLAAIFNRLPQKYQEMTVTYHGGDKSGLTRFRTDPKIQIIIGVEHSMNTGENLQIADRVIRMEIPWASGDIEQGIARVMRPDVSNKYGRTEIFDDWIIVDNSLEIQKVSRLIASSIRKVQFDEYGSDNPAYTNLPYFEDVKLELKDFNPAITARKFEDKREYFEAYDKLHRIQEEEFWIERRKVLDDNGNIIGEMFGEVNIGEELQGAVNLTHLPMMENQGYVKHEEEDNLVPFASWFSANPKGWDALDSGPVCVYTEFGYGLMTQLRTSVKNKEKGLLPTSATVELTDGKTSLTVGTELIFVAEGMSLGNHKAAKYIGANSKATKKPENIMSDVRDADGIVYRDGDNGYYEYLPSNPKKPVSNANAPKVKVKPAKPNVVPKTTVAPTANAPAVSPSKPIAKPVTQKPEEKENLPEVKPTVTKPIISEEARSKLSSLAARLAARKAQKQGAEEDDSFVPESTGDKADGKVEMSVCSVGDNIYLYANANDPDADALKAFEFKKINAYIGVRIKSLRDFETTLKLIQSEFNIVGLEAIEELRKRFSKKSQLFLGKSSPKDARFLSRVGNHTKVKNDKNIKLYHLVEGGKLFLVFDAITNPVAAKALHKRRPAGTGEAFKLHDKSYVRKYKAVASAKIAVKRINAATKITNFEEIKAYLDNIVVS